jgi:hypothetical protein
MHHTVSMGAVGGSKVARLMQYVPDAISHAMARCDTPAKDCIVQPQTGGVEF